MTPPRLLPPGAYTGFLGALCVPDDLYWVSRTPVVIAGMAYPGRADWAQLHAEGGLEDLPAVRHDQRGGGRHQCEPASDARH